MCWPLLMSRKCLNEPASVVVTAPGFHALVLGGACVNTEHFLSLMCKNEWKQRTLKCFLLPAGDGSYSYHILLKYPFVFGRVK